MMINSSIFKLLRWYNFMYVMLLYLQRNLNLLDFAIARSGIYRLYLCKWSILWTGYEFSLISGGLEKFEVINIVGPSFLNFLGRAVSRRGTWYLIFVGPITYNKKLTFYFLVFIL